MSPESLWKLFKRIKIKFISYGRLLNSFGECLDGSETREKERMRKSERESFGKDEWISADFLTAGDSTFLIKVRMEGWREKRREKERVREMEIYHGLSTWMQLIATVTAQHSDDSININ